MYKKGAKVHYYSKEEDQVLLDYINSKGGGNFPKEDKQALMDLINESFYKGVKIRTFLSVQCRLSLLNIRMKREKKAASRSADTIEQKKPPSPEIEEPVLGGNSATALRSIMGSLTKLVEEVLCENKQLKAELRAMTGIRQAAENYQKVKRTIGG
jgi:hypothetical protein